MLLKPDCLPCLLKMALDLLRKTSISETALNEIFKKVINLPAFQGKNWHQTVPPQVVEMIMRLAQDEVGNSDPFFAFKQYQNEQIAGIYSDLKKQVHAAKEPIDTAVKLSIIGNRIDVMIGEGPSDLAAYVLDKMDADISRENLSSFKERLFSARTITYLTDNCGEIVLDKLLIETLNELHPKKEVFFVVRSQPTLNDATVKEAKAIGLDSVGTVVENGIDGPVPGTILSRCSPQVNELIQQADLVISKGGGNFDSLGEEIDKLNTDVSFLLLSKCIPYRQYCNIPVDDLILYNAFK